MPPGLEGSASQGTPRVARSRSPFPAGSTTTTPPSTIARIVFRITSTASTGANAEPVVTGTEVCCSIRRTSPRWSAVAASTVAPSRS